MGWARKLLGGITALRLLLPWLPVFHTPPRFPKESASEREGSSAKHRPDCFGPFRVRADLGASRFGPVYLGRESSTNTRVVIRRSSYLKSGASSESSPICSTRSESSARRCLITRVWRVLFFFGAEGDTRTRLFRSRRHCHGRGDAAGRRSTCCRGLATDKTACRRNRLCWRARASITG